MIAAIVVLVMLSSLAAAVVRLTWSQQVGSAQDVMGVRAVQAANAGVEWGMYKALKGDWSGCTNSSETLDLRSTTGFWVTVRCTANATPYVEGGSVATPKTVRLFQIDATACNGTASCPDNTRSLSATYVERRRQATLTDVEAEL